MTNPAERASALENIRANIAKYGYHTYLVSGGNIPRFAYTIGTSESAGFELVLAGAVFYMKDDVVKVIDNIVAQLRAERGRTVFDVPGQGSFTLREVHESWASEIMLGAFDYFHKRDLPALQIVPDKAHWTVDIPDMSVPWSATKEPAWQWLRERWTYPVPEISTATTNLAALRGDRITEAMRWEEDEWELFAGAGPDVSKEELRVVPLGVLLAVDKSLEAVLKLPVGSGLWRDAPSEWHPWAPSATS
jgi:hypothetical protein